ncbi:MAG TPA: hypothetical protein VFE14_10075, partial [Micromonosporaceae bacterium]|nr:hypothetical protein [Micromonosporaceae bacterium]
DHLRPEGTRLERLERSGHRVRERIASEYRRLVPREQRALCLLTLVRSPTFLPWVLGPLLNVEQAEAENIMASLGTAQLLDNAGHDKATGLARYQFNPLVRLFATAEAARHADRMATARVRLDEAYLEVVSKVLGELPEGLPRQQQTHRWLPPSSRVHARIAELPDHGVRAEYANLIRTVEVADDRREWTMCWRVAARLHGCVPNRAELRDSVFAFGRAIRAAKTDTNPLGEIDVRLAKASFLIAVERYPWAFEVLADADARARDLEVADPREAPYAIGRQAVAHRKLAEAFLQMGAYRDASAPLATAARLAERAGSTDEMRLVRLLQAENHRVLSPEPTYADLVEGQLEDPVYFRAHLGLSEAARRRGDWHSAQEHLMTAWYHSNGDARRMAAVHYRLSRLHIDQWRHGKDDLGVPKDAGVTADDSELPRQAIRRAAEAALAFRCMDNPVGLVRARCQLVRALTIAGHLLEAEQLCHSVERSLVALRIFAGHAWSPLTARFARARGELLLHRRDVPAAWRTLVIAGTLFADNDDWASQAEVWRLLDAAQRVHPYPSGAAHMSVGGVLDTAVMPAPPARLPGGWLEYGATAPVLPRQRGNGEAPDRRRRRLP